MFVWSRGGAVRRFEISVQRDLTKLSDQVKQLFPNETIDVRGNGRNVVLAGSVSSKDVVDRAINVALGYVEKREDVVTLLQVRPGPASNQVLLKVRFAEVSRSALTEFGMSFFTSPTGIHNTLGRVTTQQFAAPEYKDLAWTKASSSFGSSVTSASGTFSVSDFLNLFLLSEKYDLGTVIAPCSSAASSRAWPSRTWWPRAARKPASSPAASSRFRWCRARRTDRPYRSSSRSSVSASTSRRR
jgi:Flp pilus assembly secretin CpaC